MPRVAINSPEDFKNPLAPAKFTMFLNYRHYRILEDSKVFTITYSKLGRLLNHTGLWYWKSKLDNLLSDATLYSLETSICSLVSPKFLNNLSVYIAMGSVFLKFAKSSRIIDS